MMSNYSKSERTADNYRHSFKSLLTEKYMDSIQSLPSFIITTLVFSQTTSVYTCQRHNCNILLNGETCISVGEVLIWYLLMKMLRSIPKKIGSIQRYFMWDKHVFLPIDYLMKTISWNSTILVTGTTSAVQFRILFPYQSPLNQKILWLSHKFSSIFPTFPHFLCLWSKKFCPIQSDKAQSQNV